jgi:phage terminase large subunit-like protein
MDGVTTYMLQMSGKFEWYKTKEEITELYGKEITNQALNFVYYSANVYDNPWIRKHQPAYIFKLENLKPVERSRLLLGNWLAKLDSEGYIRKEWFIEVPHHDIPYDTPRVRCYDLASTKPSPANKDPDWTRGVKATYDKSTGNFYILALASIRDRPAMVQNLIESVASADGRDCFIGIPVDAGASGREVADTKRARLVSAGYKVILNNTRKSKLQRAEPFLIALQAGKVFVAPGVFDDSHFEELENFDGGKCNGFHEDILDGISDCWSVLTGNMMVPTIRLGKDFNRIAAIGGKTLL